ncbi:MAG: TauD/TfdA family dioxygenase, partial [Planctomycetota bacterium]
VEQLDDATSQALFQTLVRRVGTPISQSASGETIFSVRDERFGADDPRTRGPNTKRRLSFHSDRCDVIAFMCLRQAKSGGENQIVSSMAIFNEMVQRRPDLIETLQQPFYLRRHNVDSGNKAPWCRQPIFSFCEGRFASSYLRVLIDRAYALPELPNLSQLQREALDLLEDLASDPALHVSFRLQPGDLLLLNNWVTLHRREEFVDHDDPARRRHLLRIWLSVPNSRPIDSLFRDNFGETRAGAIRGGMRPVS